MYNKNHKEHVETTNKGGCMRKNMKKTHSRNSDRCYDSYSTCQ